MGQLVRRRTTGGDVDHLAIETVALRKEFRGAPGRRHAAVQDLDLEVPVGAVHGLLGPNGSGKTTTIRMLLGLARPTSGEVRVLGQPVPRGLPQVIDRVGAVVAQPRFVPGLSGRRNLRLLADSVGISHDRVDVALDRVGLPRRDRDVYRSWSIGRRRRLAIAAALLKGPDLLVLDEPTEGLDPAGVRDVRRLIRDLGRNGVTVLLSSHLLADVQQVCDSVSIIAGGTLVSTGAVDELVGREPPGGVRVGVADPESALRVLREAGLEAGRDGTLVYVAEVTDPADLTRLLASHDIWVRELVPDGIDLDELFGPTRGRATGIDTDGGHR
jgi:ABC-2 type transport system ATP-binding protein